MDQECQLDTLAWVSMACEHIRDFRFPVSDSHLSGNALAFQWLTSQERDSVLFLRDSRVIFASAEMGEFSLNNLTLEFSLCFFSYRSRKSGCLCIPSCRFFFLFGHECVYLCVRPQFKVIFDHKLNGCTENGILLSMGVWLINNVALDWLCALYKPTLLPFSIWISLSL